MYSVTDSFNEKKSYISIKAHEGMIAFVSFLIKLQGDKAQKEGILKISSSKKPYGGGYLTLTFMVDTDGYSPIKDELNQYFEMLTEKSLRENMGIKFETLSKVSLDTVAHIEDWYIEELHIHFKALAGEEKTIVEQYLLPALKKSLPCTFQPVEWWPLDKIERAAASSEEDWVDLLTSGSVKALFKKWFGP